MKRAEEVKEMQSAEGLFLYEPGDILLIHLDFSKIQEKLNKTRRTFNRLAQFLAYDHGNVVCRILRKLGRMTEEEKEQALIQNHDIQRRGSEHTKEATLNTSNDEAFWNKRNADLSGNTAYSIEQIVADILKEDPPAKKRSHKKKSRQIDYDNLIVPNNLKPVKEIFGRPFHGLYYDEI
jgi:hypothetical protein